MNVSGKILLFILVFSGFSALRCGATVYHSDGSAASVQGLHNAVLNGDTITLPAGTFTWSDTRKSHQGGYSARRRRRRDDHQGCCSERQSHQLDACRRPLIQIDRD